MQFSNEEHFERKLIGINQAVKRSLPFASTSMLDQMDSNNKLYNYFPIY